MTQTAQNGTARVFTRFGRDDNRRTTGRSDTAGGHRGRWYDCDVSARGL